MKKISFIIPTILFLFVLSDNAIGANSSANNQTGSLWHLAKFVDRLPEDLTLNERDGDGRNRYKEAYDSIWDDPILRRAAEDGVGKAFLQRALKEDKEMEGRSPIMKKGHVLVIFYCRVELCFQDNIYFLANMDKGTFSACVRGAEDYFGGGEEGQYDHVVEFGKVKRMPHGFCDSRYEDVFPR